MFTTSLSAMRLPGGILSFKVSKQELVVTGGQPYASYSALVRKRDLEATGMALLSRAGRSLVQPWASAKRRNTLAMNERNVDIARGSNANTIATSSLLLSLKCAADVARVVTVVNPVRRGAKPSCMRDIVELIPGVQ